MSSQRKFIVGDNEQTIGVIFGALDSDNNFFALDSCQQTINKNSDGTVDTIVATDGINIWIQTWSYPSELQIVSSKWVKQH